MLGTGKGKALTKEEAQAALEALLKEAVQAREDLLAGRDMQIADIHTRIETACQNALALPNEDVVELAGVIRDLRDALTDISQVLAEVEHRLKDQDVANDDEQ